MYLSDVSIDAKELFNRLATPRTASIISLNASCGEWTVGELLSLSLKEETISMPEDISALVKDDDVVYTITDLHKYETIDEMNSKILKFNKAILVKSGLTSPNDLTCYLICSNRRSKHVNDLRVANNDEKIKRFLYSLLANFAYSLELK